MPVSFKYFAAFVLVLVFVRGICAGDEALLHHEARKAWFALTLQKLEPEVEGQRQEEIPQFHIVECEKRNGDKVWVSGNSLGWVDRHKLLPMEEGIEYLTEYVSHQPTDVEALATLAYLHFSEGNDEKVEEVIAAIPSTGQDASCVRYLKALVKAYTDDDIKGARREVQQLVEDGNRNSYWFALLANALLNGEQFAEMPDITALSAIHKTSKSRDVQVLFAKMAMANRNYEEMLSRCDQLLQKSEWDARVIWLKATALSCLGRHEEGKQVLDDAILKWPDSSHARYLRGIALHRMGELAGAEIDLRIAYADRSDRTVAAHRNSRITFALAKVIADIERRKGEHSDSARVQEATTLAREASKANEHRDVEMATAYALLLAWKGGYSEARQVLAECQAANSGNASAESRLTLAYLAIDDLEHFKKAD